MTSKLVSTSIRFDQEVHERLLKESRDRMVSVTWLVNRLVKDGLEKLVPIDSYLSEPKAPAFVPSIVQVTHVAFSAKNLGQTPEEIFFEWEDKGIDRVYLVDEEENNDLFVYLTRSGWRYQGYFSITDGKYVGRNAQLLVKET